MDTMDKRPPGSSMECMATDPTDWMPPWRSAVHREQNPQSIAFPTPHIRTASHRKKAWLHLWRSSSLKASQENYRTIDQQLPCLCEEPLVGMPNRWSATADVKQPRDKRGRIQTESPNWENTRVNQMVRSSARPWATEANICGHYQNSVLPPQ